ncbi:MAG: FliH/SctL family protein [Gammaproteobacteria bacterium]|nr:FliH/SctL family protein [Gammaproteobacteria bacterium]
MSDFDFDKSNKSFKDAVSWSLPAVEGDIINKHTQPRAQLEIDDVRLFEERIQKRIQRIKQQEETPTFLTVKQIEEVQTQAYDEAYKVGFEEAYKKGTEDSERFIQEQLVAERAVLKQNAQQLQNCFNMLSKPLDAVDQDVEQQLTETVFYFCKQILAHELRIDSTHVLHLMQQAITRLPVAQRQIIIHLNPADIALLEQDGISDSDHGWTFEADTGVSAGGCIIKTEVASIDLSLEKRLSEITDQLFSGLKPPAAVQDINENEVAGDTEITND